MEISMDVEIKEDKEDKDKEKKFLSKEEIIEEYNKIHNIREIMIQLQLNCIKDASLKFRVYESILPNEKIRKEYETICKELSDTWKIEYVKNDYGDYYEFAFVE